MTNEEAKRMPIDQLLWHIREDEAKPEFVRMALADLHEKLVNERPIEPEYFELITESLGRYLDGSRNSLDRAFGLKRRPGRPSSDEGELIAIATKVLAERLAGSTYEAGVARAVDFFHKSETVIKDSWAAHNQDALLSLAVQRRLQTNEYPWSKDEVARLTEIFSSEKWFIAPS